MDTTDRTEAIFSEMSQAFQPGAMKESLSYYFSIDALKKTVFIDSRACRILSGKALDNADCVCKTSAAFFEKIWDQGYRPGLKDFLSGAIRSNNPEALKIFLTAFSKNS